MEEYVCTKCTLGIEFIDERESVEEAVFEGTVEDGIINEHIKSIDNASTEEVTKNDQITLEEITEKKRVDKELKKKAEENKNLQQTILDLKEQRKIEYSKHKELKDSYDKRMIELEKLVQSTKDKLAEEIEDIVEKAQSREDVLKKKLELSSFENERIKTVANKLINKLDNDIKDVHSQLLNRDQKLKEIIKEKEKLIQEHKTSMDTATRGKLRPEANKDLGWQQSHQW